jgi:2-oxoglutarate ferredoxin oxidoreductase subunit alpha
MPRNTGEVLKRYKKVLVPELNCGQLRLLLRAEFLVDAVGLNKVQGKPFLVSEIEAKIEEMLSAKGAARMSVNMEGSLIGDFVDDADEAR